MANPIAKEIPTGNCNGANLVFNLSHDVEEVDDVWVDGVIYTGAITIAGSQITLADAPLYSIHVDYMPTQSPIA